MKEIVKNIYHLGDSGCSVYLINTDSKDGLVLIDCGMNLNMIKRISKIGLNPQQIKHCILTHQHIDHIAICSDFKDYNMKVKFYAHQLDAIPIEEKGHDRETAASWYGINYNPVKLEKRFEGELEILKFGDFEFHCIHTPGHTPGSISILIEIEGKRVLFGQDLHGPIIPGVSNFGDYQISLRKLKALNADILCEGHFGIFQPASEVQRYIESFIE
ncbi:MAG: MBL fold metallo-hydrolase [Promethearchaeota archaeon]|jgi:glyoxylase-like metal-dependent hydrolase (beta-lactamase superfamily II)